MEDYTPQTEMVLSQAQWRAIREWRLQFHDMRVGAAGDEITYELSRGRTRAVHYSGAALTLEGDVRLELKPRLEARFQAWARQFGEDAPFTFRVTPTWMFGLLVTVEHASGATLRLDDYEEGRR
jgi:hypothetical protein